KFNLVRCKFTALSYSMSLKGRFCFLLVLYDGFKLFQFVLYLVSFGCVTGFYLSLSLSLPSSLSLSLFLPLSLPLAFPHSAPLPSPFLSLALFSSLCLSL